jgi:hypothetical protein
MRISRFPARAVASFIGITFVALGFVTPAQGQSPNFSAATNFAVGTGPPSMAVGDCNGEGQIDLAVANNGEKTRSARQRRDGGRDAVSSSVAVLK